MIMIRIILILFTISFVSAHNIKPAFLEIKANHDSTNYSIRYKIPILQETIQTFREPVPHFPPDCSIEGEKISYETKNTYVQIWNISCAKSLDNRMITFDAIATNYMDVIVSLQNRDAEPYFTRVTPSKTEVIFHTVNKEISLMQNYIFLGIEHMLLGFDHLLFVFVLFLLIENWKKLLIAITSFTIAHSITLYLGVLNYITISSNLIEALIALSIIILATEVIYANNNKKVFTLHHPYLIASLFGLLHGLGFANVLGEIGLPQHGTLLSLFLFNFGLELGQIFFLVTLIVPYFLLSKLVSIQNISIGKKMFSYITGSIASLWFIERVYILY